MTITTTTEDPEDPEGPGVRDVLIWDVTPVEKNASKAYLVVQGSVLWGRFDGPDAWSKAWKEAEKRGVRHAIWSKARDGAMERQRPAASADERLCA